MMRRSLRFESFTLDLGRLALYGPSGQKDLRRKSFEVLRYLVEHAGRVIAKQELMKAVWPDVIVGDESLTQCVSEVRRALGDDDQRIIKTVPRRGYLLDVSISPTRDPQTFMPSSTPEPPDRPSIAVLPFTDLSGEGQEYFADGMVEDLTTELSRFSELFVIARNSSFQYRGKAVDIQQVARDLGVRYILEGSVRKAGERIRISAQLIDGATGAHLWAERYDRHVQGIFDIQDEITTSIVGRIGPELLAAEYARASRKPPHSLSAWECVIRALFLSSQQSEAATGNSLRLLEQALDHDPDYAQALGMKAWIMVFRAFQGWGDMAPALVQAKTLIAHAMAVDNDELWPHLAQGMVGYATRDNEAAMAALTRAVALSPNSVNARGHLGIAHAFGGRSTEAVASIDYAVRLSPRDTFLSDFQLYYAFAHFQGARYELGLQFAQQAHRMRPGHPYPLLLGAACAGHLAEEATASALLRELKAIVPIATATWVEATSPYVLADDRARLVVGLSRAGLD
jgi:adenylate cyclase